MTPAPDGLVADSSTVSREVVTIAAGYKLLRGSVLGEITSSTPSEGKYAGQYAPCVATATDGSQVPAAIIAEDVDTSSTGTNGAAATCAYRTGRFNALWVLSDASWNQAALTTALAAINIII